MRNLDTKVIALGLGAFLLVFSLLIFMGIKVFSPNDSTNEPTTSNESKTHNESGESLTEKIDEPSSDEHVMDDPFKESWSDTKFVTFFNKITLSPVKTLENVNLPDTHSNLMDTFEGNILFKAEPDHLYYFDSLTKKQVVIDEGVNLARFDQKSGLIYYTKGYLIYEKVFQYDTKTKIKNELYRINMFQATHLDIQNDVAMVTGYEYIANQSIPERRYYSVFIPNFLNENIFRKNTFILENTNQQPFLSYNEDIYVAFYNTQNASFDVTSFSTQTAHEFVLATSKKIDQNELLSFTKEAKLDISPNHYLLYQYNKFFLDGQMYEYHQNIKKMEFIDDEHVLILGDSLELSLFSITNHQFELLQNNAFNYQLDGVNLYIETVNNQILLTQLNQL